MRSLLIVEDEAIVALDLQGQLETKGFHVCALVGRPEDVVHAVRTHRPDVVLMDVHLRGEVDGVMLAEELFVCDDTPVVFLTAFSDRTIMGRAACTGAYGFLTKPVTVAALASTLELAVQKHAALRLQREESRWLGDAEVAAVGMELDGRVGYMNRAAVRLTGWMPLELQIERPRWVGQLAGIASGNDGLVHAMGLEVRSQAKAVDVKITRSALNDGANLYLIYRA